MSTDSCHGRFLLFLLIYPFISPFQDVLKGLVAVVSVKLHKEGWIEGIGVSNEAEHSHSHLSKQRS